MSRTQMLLFGYPPVVGQLYRPSALLLLPVAVLLRVAGGVFRWRCMRRALWLLFRGCEGSSA